MLALRTENRWLERGHKFFRTLSRNGVLRGALLHRGLTTEEFRRGWELFAAAMGVQREAPQVQLPTTNAVDAEARIQAWEAPTHAATQATLEYRMPAACAYLLDGVARSKRFSAVAGVEQFLLRVAALRAGTAPGVTASDAALAVRLLEERRIVGESIETQLSEWIEQAKFGVSPVFPREDEGANEKAFIAYRNWLNEWREIARTTFTQRRHLIALGLAGLREHDEPAPSATIEPAPASVH